MRDASQIRTVHSTQHQLVLLYAMVVCAPDGLHHCIFKTCGNVQRAKHSTVCHTVMFP